MSKPYFSINRVIIALALSSVPLARATVIDLIVKKPANQYEWLSRSTSKLFKVQDSMPASTVMLLRESEDKEDAEKYLGDLRRQYPILASQLETLSWEGQDNQTLIFVVFFFLKYGNPEFVAVLEQSEWMQNALSGSAPEHPRFISFLRWLQTFDWLVKQLIPRKNAEDALKILMFIFERSAYQSKGFFEPPPKGVSCNPLHLNSIDLLTVAIDYPSAFAIFMQSPPLLDFVMKLGTVLIDGLYNSRRSLVFAAKTLSQYPNLDRLSLAYALIGSAYQDEHGKDMRKPVDLEHLWLNGALRTIFARRMPLAVVNSAHMASATVNMIMNSVCPLVSISGQNLCPVTIDQVNSALAQMGGYYWGDVEGVTALLEYLLWYPELFAPVISFLDQGGSLNLLIACLDDPESFRKALQEKLGDAVSLMGSGDCTPSGG